MSELEMSDTERSLLAVLQDGLPCSRTPYKDMAEKAGIPTEQLLEILEKWKKQGRLRRIGAIVNHFEAGLGAGAMVVWQVESERTEQVGRILAGLKEISHAYERQTKENWPYNLYSMVHAKNPEELEQIVKKISRACGVSNYRILFTEKELKKTPPKYIGQ
jgi:DNA-binding Lrp family transcriptional regulator